MNMRQLVKKLRASQPSGTVDEQLELDRQQWLQDLSSLMKALRSWLKEGEEEQVFKIEDDKVELVEQDLGAYEAPSLRIFARTLGRTVKVLPKGLRIVGSVQDGARLVNAKGRVDLISGARRCTLLRTPSREWKIAAPPLVARSHLVDVAKSDLPALDADTFSEVLDAVLDLHAGDE
jgi:hypothetical protein